MSFLRSLTPYLCIDTWNFTLLKRDVGTDDTDKAQLGICIRGISTNFDICENLLG